MARGDPIRDALARVPLFADLNRRQRRRIGQLATRLDVPAGVTLVEQGHAGNELVVVLSGTLEVVRDGIVISRLGRGDFFGEHALLDQQPRNATVRAATPSVVEIVGAVEFRSLCASAPRIEATIRRTSTTRTPAADAGIAPS